MSPCASLLYSVMPGLDLRFSWGRYYQSQDIREIHVKDGVDHFYSAQRADHLIADMAC